MVKKLFALASVTALTGLVAATSLAGCSDSTDNAGGGTEEDSGPKDAGRDRTVPEAGPDPTEEMCWSEDPVDATTVPYKKARIQPGSCSDDITDQIDAFIDKNPQATFDDLKAELAKDSQACADCVFGEDGDSWAPVVTDDGKIAAINLGGCIEVESGKEDCGRAFQQWNLCLESVCQQCEDDTEARDCFSGAQETACGDASQALVAACGNNVNAFIQACFKAGQPSIYGPIRNLCVGKGADAGND